MIDRPITPPPELRQLWAQQAQRMSSRNPVEWMQHVSQKAAQWGADQELEACCKWLAVAWKSYAAVELRAARRPSPKPPSLKEQALAVLESVAVHELYGGATADNRLSADDMRTIRRAIEALPDE